jgi:hypothetical protein
MCPSGQYWIRPRLKLIKTIIMQRKINYEFNDIILDSFIISVKYSPVLMAICVDT